MRLRSSPPPLSPASFFPPGLLHPAHRLSPFIPPSPSAVVLPQRRHRLRRPPLNQVSDYLLEIDFTCSVRFCICTSATVRRTSTIVRTTSWTSRPMGPVLVLILRLRLSFSWSSSSASLLFTFPLTAPICGRFPNSAEFLPGLLCITIATIRHGTSSSHAYLTLPLL